MKFYGSKRKYQTPTLAKRDSLKHISETEVPITTGFQPASDRRLKKDIVYLTSTDEGIKLYSFRYLWSDVQYVGVMAQDLLLDGTFKEAVVLKSNGFYAVDYSKLGLKMVSLEEWGEDNIHLNETIAI